MRLPERWLYAYQYTGDIGYLVLSRVLVAILLHYNNDLARVRVLARWWQQLSCGGGGGYAFTALRRRRHWC